MIKVMPADSRHRVFPELFAGSGGDGSKEGGQEDEQVGDQQVEDDGDDRGLPSSISPMLLNHTPTQRIDLDA